MEERSLFVIAYDIPDDKRRLRVARLLERYGERVQYSVFEMYLTVAEWQQLQTQLRARLNLEEDGVRVYRLCRGCARRREQWGVGPRVEAPAVVWVV